MSHSQRDAPVEIVADLANRCGESPLWDAANRRLLWTDIPANHVYEFTPATGATRVFSRDINVSSIALARDGRLIFGGATGLGVWSDKTGYQPLVSEHQGDSLIINDMIATPAGGIYFGTIYWGERGMEKRGKLYLMDAAGAVRVVDDGIELANGLGFGPDARTLYFADSAPRRIYAYDVDPQSGSLSRKRVFAQLTRDDGLPDGLTVDADAHVWCACWYGGQVIRFDPDGKIERRIAIPAIQVSSVAFGGDNLDELYVTTAAEPWPSELAPAAYRPDSPKQGGPLYRLRPGVRGRREYLAAVTIR
jgi:sugar lactone lactonase YvrE